MTPSCSWAPRDTTSRNRADDYKLGSAGKALDKVRLEIDHAATEEGAKDGKVIVYGPNVMQGYHNRPDQTRATFTADGGLRSGDRAYIDEDGFPFITGRIKEQFKLENGKFVFPAALEEEIKLLRSAGAAKPAVLFGAKAPTTSEPTMKASTAPASWSDRRPADR